MVIGYYLYVDSSYPLISATFYPSITNKLPEKSLTFASQFSNISEEDIRIIKHTKKLHSFKDGITWAKISSDFDGTMGSFDGAELCKLVGL